MINFFLYYIIIFFFISCDNNPIPRTYKLKKISLSDNFESKQKVDFKITWDIPGNWKEIPGNSFSLSMYEIIDANDYSEISITQFPGDAGGIESNVNRWRRQLSLAPHSIDEIISNSKFNSNLIGKFTIHEIINNDKPESAFLTMILPLDDSTIFVKLKTTKNGIESLKKIFLNFCLTFKYIN